MVKHMRPDEGPEVSADGMPPRGASHRSTGTRQSVGSHAEASMIPASDRSDSRHRKPRSFSGMGASDTRATRKPAPRPGKKGNSSQLLSTVLIVVGVVLLLVAGGMWGFAQYRYWKQDQINTQLQQTAIIREPDAPAADEPKLPYPQIDWAALKAVNDDVVGWIYVPDTVINYPVYQGVDNDQYLRTTATGEWSVGGQLFLDWESTAPGMLDQQSIIYGHHMLDGTLFQPIAWLEDQAEFDKMETLWYLTEQKVYELEPLMVYYTVPTDTEVRRFRFSSNEEFRAYLMDYLGKSVSMRSDAAEIIKGAKHVLTLSTCNYYDEWGRTLLIAIPKDEAAAALDGTTAKEEAAAQAQAAQQQEEGQPVDEQPVEGEGEYAEEPYEEPVVDEAYQEPVAEDYYYQDAADQTYYEGTGEEYAYTEY